MSITDIRRMMILQDMAYEMVLTKDLEIELEKLEEEYDEYILKEHE